MTTIQEREVLMEFIEVYRENPCLWDMTSDLYKNKEMKQAAWVLLTNVLKKMDPYANVATTKKKVENLRSVYFRELKKVRASRLHAADDGDVFVPNLWYYKLINFLDSEEWGPGRRGSGSDPLRPEGEGVKRAPPSDEDSIESVEMLEPEIGESPPPSKRKQPTRDQSTLKSKRISEDSNSIQQAFVESFIYPENPFQEPEHTNQNLNSFGIYVGEQLDKISTFSTFQRHVAEKLISEVLFLAKTDNLNYDSRIETPSKLSQSNYSICQSPDDILCPRKVEVESEQSEESDSRTGRSTLLKELLIDRKK